MRKTIGILLLILTVLLFITAFVSCKKNEQQAQVAAAEQLSKGFSCVAQVNLNGNPYTVQFSKPSDGNCTLSFLKPAELSSLSFALGENGTVVNYKGLQATVDPSSIPQAAIINALIGAFDATTGKSGVHASLSGQNIRIAGTSEAGTFTLILNRDFTPKQLNIPALKMGISFSGFKYL
jgi:hypothetical protein